MNAPVYIFSHQHFFDTASLHFYTYSLRVSVQGLYVPLSGYPYTIIKDQSKVTYDYVEVMSAEMLRSQLKVSVVSETVGNHSCFGWYHEWRDAVLD